MTAHPTDKPPLSAVPNTPSEESAVYVQPIRDYSGLSREQLERRLSMAEDVALMFSWSPARHETDREKAAHELWRLWLAEVGDGWTRPKMHPHLRDSAIRPLVALRDRARAQTLARIRDSAGSAMTPSAQDGGR